MTALTQRVLETPMAPYINLLNGMSSEQKQILVMYITESMKESAKEKKSNAEIIREKYKNMKISPEIERLRGCLKLTESEKQDAHTQYILGQ